MELDDVITRVAGKYPGFFMESRPSTDGDLIHIYVQRYRPRNSFEDDCHVIGDVECDLREALSERSMLIRMMMVRPDSLEVVVPAPA